MKRCERLGVEKFVGLADHLSMLQRAELESPRTEFEAAWNKLNRCDIRGLVALDYYLLDDLGNATLHARACLTEADEFLFGTWRKGFKTPEGKTDARWWREKFTWMEVYGHCLLWGSALGDWSFVKKASEFPDEEACLSMGTKPQDRDALVAIAAIMLGGSRDKCLPHINRVEAGPKRGGKLLSEALRSLLDSDAATIHKNLAAYFQHYKKAEFPKGQLTKKVSIEGTLMIHWLQHRGITIERLSQFEDHVVKFT